MQVYRISPARLEAGRPADVRHPVYLIPAAALPNKPTKGSTASGENSESSRLENIEVHKVLFFDTFSKAFQLTLKKYSAIRSPRQQCI